MTQARFGGRGRSDGRAGRDGRGGAGRTGRGAGYSSASKTVKHGLCKELEGHVFEYGGQGAADKMRVTMEKIHQLVGLKFGEDVANELKNRAKVNLPPPEYSAAAKARHVAYETMIRTQQSTLLTAMQAQLKALEAAATTAAAAVATASMSSTISGSGGVSGASSIVPVLDDEALLKIARLKNEIAEIEYESKQDVPYKLTGEEATLYSNEMKSHSYRVATLEKHRGQAFAQLLLDKMKQEKKWEVVSASYDPLELYKLIECVVLKQTEDQYVVAAMWDQYRQVYNSQQGTLSNTLYYETFRTKVEVAESVGCTFADDRTREYCAQDEFKSSYDSLSADDKAKVDDSARDRFIAYGLLRTSGKEHDHLKHALSDDFAKGGDNYPRTPQQTLLLLDKYSKAPTVVTQSEGTSFAQTGKKKGGGKKKSDAVDPKKVEFDKDFYKDKECYRCGKLGHPKSACTVKLNKDADDDKSVGSKRSSSSDMAKAVSEIKNATKQIGKAMTQVNERIDQLIDDDDSIGGQSHAQLGRIVSCGSGVAFASSAKLIRDLVLIDSCSSDNVFCNPHLVSNVRRGERQLNLESNGGYLPISEIADFKGFNEPVWFSKKAITNILSLLLVKKEYPVSYDGEDFIVHRASHGYSDMVFKPHPTGLHVWDINDPRSHASYTFAVIETVADNMKMFTKRQIDGGNLARDLQAGLAYPSNGDLKWITQANMLKDSPVGPQDVDVALKIYGPSVALLKGKTVRQKAPVARQDVVAVPKEIRQLHKRVTLTIDIFLSTVSHFLQL